METINVDGVEYAIAQFSTEVKGFINTFNILTAQKQEAQIELFKCDQALNTMNGVLADKIREELEAKKPAQEVTQ